MPEKKQIWPVGPLCRLSGEDAWIILHAETDLDVVGKFSVIGGLVLIIFFLSVYSSVHFLVNLLNGGHLFAITIGLFWGCMIANIYYLLLFTVTPPILKGREHAERGVPKEVTTEKKLLSRVSLMFRLLFVILLAIVIAQPWLVTIFNTSRWIEQDRREYRAEFIRLADSTEPSGDFSGGTGRRVRDHREIDRLLAANNFYTRKIQLINRHYPMAWMVTFVVVLFFIVPIGLKYWIRSKSNFYGIKKDLEEVFLLGRYDQFKQRYAAIFADRFGIATEWYESCTDPPFNTRKKKQDQQHLDQQQLLDKIYKDAGDSENNKYLLHETVS
jgi:hypothetical protein